MAVQTTGTTTNVPFSSGNAIAAIGTIKQDAARTTVLASKTLMGKVAATQKWVPVTDLTVTTGPAAVFGIYVGDDIPAASLVAGDVANCSIIIGGAPLFIDKSQLVLENSLTLASLIGTTMNVEDLLTRTGIYAGTMENIFA
jgi:hypothetical protein